MSAETSKTSQVTVILPENAVYRPLGVKIRKIEYQMPEGFDNVGDLRNYLFYVRQHVQKGDKSNVLSLWQDLGLSTSNLESFRDFDPSNALWWEFVETTRLIANQLLTQGAQGRKAAADFLRPMAYYDIPEDPDHLWGYPLQTVDHHRIPNAMPSRCSWRLLEENADSMLSELHRDLTESFERRENPGSRPSQDQCHEPYQPIQYRLEAGIAGAQEIGEGEETPLAAEGVSQIEFGKNLHGAQPLPTKREWTIDSYTCSEPPQLAEITGDRVTLRAPKVLYEDCQAVISLKETGPLGGPVAVQHRVDILNSKNEPPTVKITERREGYEGYKVTLTASAKDPNGDDLEYWWDRIPGPIVMIEEYRNNGRTKGFNCLTPDPIVYRVTVTDQPEGKRPGAPQSVVAEHKVMCDSAPVKLDSPIPIERIARDPKRKGLADLAKATGGKPRVALPDSLVETIKEAVVPEKMVDSIDLVFAIDASGSMLDDIEKLQARISEVLEAMRQKVKDRDLSRIRVGIVSYVDNETVTHLPLTLADSVSIRVALGMALLRIQLRGGSLETVWDALYQTIERESWKGEFRKLVYLTDEGGDTGKLGKAKADVDRIADARDVVVEPIFFELFDAIYSYNELYEKINFIPINPINSSKLIIKKEIKEIIENPEFYEIIENPTKFNKKIPPYNQ